MGTDWYLRKKPGRRPVKSGLERKRRQKTQAKRLAGLGVPEAEIKQMNSKEVRTALKTPAKVIKSVAKAKAKAKAKA